MTTGRPPTAATLAAIDRLYATTRVAPLENPPPLSPEEEAMIEDFVFLLTSARDRRRTMSVLRALIPIVASVAFPLTHQGDPYDQA